MNQFEILKTLVLSLEDEFYKFYEKNNKAAGGRIRKGMQTLKKIDTRNPNECIGL